MTKIKLTLKKFIIKKKTKGNITFDLCKQIRKKNI